ncbi:MAG: YitT family protein [Clostridia bacterium]|nr:YitT family protein [Clostridia bacterium]
MKEIQRAKNVKSQLKSLKPLNFLWLSIAGFINAFGVTLFLTPVGLYDGGFSGTSIILSQNAPISLSVFLLVLNFPFFIFGFKKLGLQFVFYSLYSIGVYSLFAYMFQYVFNIDFSVGSPFAYRDLILCAICGGLLSGLGSGIVIRFGGALDGIEVLAVLFSKKLGLTVGTFVMMYNAVLFIIAGVVTQSFELPLYSIIAYACGIKTVDFVVEGFDRAKSAFIITERDEAMSKAISEELGRGVTIINAKGYYSKSKKMVLYCVVNRFEIYRLKTVVEGIDPNAFVTISEVSDSLGTSLKIRSRNRYKTSNEIDSNNKIIAESKLPQEISENLNSESVAQKSGKETRID